MIGQAFACLEREERALEDEFGDAFMNIRNDALQIIVDNPQLTFREAFLRARKRVCSECGRLK